ncbi:hypothetical protein PVAG01_04415 [Phlyctema vagabunda]|uniref:Uncharacterized protein n=1 Tax=Phlyctema vagabunda TaxID=108571 RepID=A0ABR4PPA6_9HELO
MATLAIRQRYTDLTPLQISTTPSPDENLVSTSAISHASFALPSPSIQAARQYYRDHAVPGIYNVDQLIPKPISISKDAPRRHSVMTTTITKKLESISISSVATLPKIAEGAQLEPVQFKGPKGKQNDLMKISKVTTRRQSADSTARPIGPIPFQYSHDRLRTWGNTYLGNTATADAYVNAVSLRRPSLALTKDGIREGAGPTSRLTAFRARVTPRDKDRKPFLIQKQLDIEDLRAAIPPVSSREPYSAANPRRSSRLRQSVSGPSQQSPSRDRGTGATLQRDIVALGSGGALPIHIEYALHYLPALAALMLSGHVRKGDSIDLPLPHPQAWPDVLCYVYTGQGLMSDAVKENISYLAGRSE